MSDDPNGAVLEYIAVQIERLRRQADAIDEPLLAHLLDMALAEAQDRKRSLEAEE